METKGLGFPMPMGRWGSVCGVGHEAKEQVFNPSPACPENTSQ